MGEWILFFAQTIGPNLSELIIADDEMSFIERRSDVERFKETRNIERDGHIVKKKVRSRHLNEDQNR